jgi:hypothetical protein
MNVASDLPLVRAPNRALAPILTGGVIAGAIDLTFACVFNGIRSGISPVRILDIIASGVLGKAAFDGGAAVAALGFAAHFFILIVAAAIYYAASRRLALLRSHAYLSGMAFGAGIYATMHLVVLPLSAAPVFKFAWVPFVCDFAVHVLLLGPAIALAVRHFDRAATR